MSPGTLALRSAARCRAGVSPSLMGRWLALDKTTRLKMAESILRERNSTGKQVEG